MSEKHIKSAKKLITALSNLNSLKDTENFIIDLLSPKEIVEFSRRFEVAELLEKGIKYSEIEEKTGMSSTTISRISKALNSEKKGYKKALKTIKNYK